MKYMKQIVCPVSDEKINEQITRLNAILVLLFVIGGLAFQSSFLFVFLLADFYIRAFTKARFSPISYASYRLAIALNLTEKRIDKAPKIFAARLGFLMMLVMVLLYFSGFKSMAVAVGGILIFFAGLESAFAICAGCIIYTYLVLPFYR